MDDLKRRKLAAMEPEGLLALGMRAMAAPSLRSLEDFKEVSFALGHRRTAAAARALAALALGQEGSGAWPMFDPFAHYLNFCGGQVRGGSFVARAMAYAKDSAGTLKLQALLAGSSAEVEALARSVHELHAEVGECLAIRWRRWPYMKSVELAELASFPNAPEAYKRAAFREELLACCAPAAPSIRARSL